MGSTKFIIAFFWRLAILLAAIYASHHFWGQNFWASLGCALGAYWQFYRIEKMTE